MSAATPATMPLAALVELMLAEVDDIEGQITWFTQPIEQRINEMISGVRADVAVKLFGESFETLIPKAAELQRLLGSIGGCVDLTTEQVAGQPILRIAVRQDDIARYGIPAEVVLDVVESVSSKVLGEVVEGQLRFPLVVRLPEHLRASPEAIGNILINGPSGERFPLSRVADVQLISGPKLITREWGQRRIAVQCNVRGRDVGSFGRCPRRMIAASKRSAYSGNLAFASSYTFFACFAASGSFDTSCDRPRRSAAYAAVFLLSALAVAPSSSTTAFRCSRAAARSGLSAAIAVPCSCTTANSPASPASALPAGDGSFRLATICLARVGSPARIAEAASAAVTGPPALPDPVLLLPVPCLPVLFWACGLSLGSRSPKYAPAKPGEVQVTLEVDKLEGETITTNNSITTYATVTKEGISVLLVDRIRLEQKFIRRALESDPRFRVFASWRVGEVAPAGVDLFGAIALARTHIALLAPRDGAVEMRVEGEFDCCVHQ
jgi:hypothetical protein